MERFRLVQAPRYSYYGLVIYSPSLLWISKCISNTKLLVMCVCVCFCVLHLGGDDIWVNWLSIDIDLEIMDFTCPWDMIYGNGDGDGDEE